MSDIHGRDDWRGPRPIEADAIADDAKPTLAKVGEAVLWHGPYLRLSDLPDGHRAMVYREAGGWLVGTDAQLDAAKALIDAARSENT